MLAFKFSIWNSLFQVIFALLQAWFGLRPLRFWNDFIAVEAIACKQPMESACLPLCASLVGFFVFSLPLLAWLSCCLVGLLAGCLLGWLARLVGSLAGLLVGWLPGWLVGWLAGWFASCLLGWQVACFNWCFALHVSAWLSICLIWLPLCLCLGHKFGNGN